jgi:hypothetical protein
MNLSRLFLIVVALMFIASSSPATAAAKTPPPPNDHRILVQSVNVKHGTVTLQYMWNKSVHVYTLDASSTVTVKGKPATISDIKSGMRVLDSIDRDEHTLDSITVG